MPPPNSVHEPALFWLSRTFDERGSSTGERRPHFRGDSRPFRMGAAPASSGAREDRDMIPIDPPDVPLARAVEQPYPEAPTSWRPSRRHACRWPSRTRDPWPRGDRASPRRAAAERRASRSRRSPSGPARRPASRSARQPAASGRRHPRLWRGPPSPRDGPKAARPTRRSLLRRSWSRCRSRSTRTNAGNSSACSQRPTVGGALAGPARARFPVPTSPGAGPRPPSRTRDSSCRIPARSSVVVNALPHAEHENWIAMDRRSSPRKIPRSISAPIISRDGPAAMGATVWPNRMIQLGDATTASRRSCSRGPHRCRAAGPANATGAGIAPGAQVP